uniref:70 kDa subunit of replication protein A n=1 Tax=Solanum tuberosum TaxID=4113 RepID=M1BTJ2_SOLTU
MVLRLNIDRIELATRDWICKVQIVEIGRPRESLDKKCRFQIFILEDEEECQIKAVMYADEIGQYADKLKLMNTYFISTAKVKVSLTSYGKPIHKFYWVLDKETVIEHIKPSTELETSLPPPTKLNITTFDRIPHMMVDSAAEIGISILIAIISLKYTYLLIHTLTTFHYVLYKQIYWQSLFVVVFKNTQVALIISVEK